MASAQEIVDALDAAILRMAEGGGVQRVRVGGQEVEYASLAELRKARAEWAADAASAAGTRPRRLVVNFH